MTYPDNKIDGSGQKQMIEQAGQEITHLAARLASLGLSPGASGNISIRVGAWALMTPTGSAFSHLTVPGLARIRIEDGFVSAEGGRASKEAPVHLGLYRINGQIGAVVHLHSPYATAVSCLPVHDDGSAGIGVYTPYQIMRLGRLQVVPYAPPGSEELGTLVSALLKQPGVVLMSHHGLVSAGRDLNQAVELAEEAEAACRVAMMLRGSEKTELADEEIARLRAIYG